MPRSVLLKQFPSRDTQTLPFHSSSQHYPLRRPSTVCPWCSGVSQSQRGRSKAKDRAKIECLPCQVATRHSPSRNERALGPCLGPHPTSKRRMWCAQCVSVCVHVCVHKHMLMVDNIYIYISILSQFLLQHQQKSQPALTRTNAERPRTFGSIQCSSTDDCRVSGRLGNKSGSVNENLRICPSLFKTVCWSETPGRDWPCALVFQSLETWRGPLGST